MEKAAGVGWIEKLEIEGEILEIAGEGKEREREREARPGVGS